MALSVATMAAHELITPPEVPVGLDVDPGFKPFLVGHAIGTQNFVCAPRAKGVEDGAVAASIGTAGRGRAACGAGR